MVLTEAQPGSRQVLPHRARADGPVELRRKGLPQLGAAAAEHADPGPRAGVFPAPVDAVHRLVGEEGAFGVAAAGSQGAGRGHESPHVAVAGQGDEERCRPVVAVDAIPGATVVVDEAALHRSPGADHAVPDATKVAIERGGSSTARQVPSTHSEKRSA